jgi:hypothetical protein
LEKDLNTRFEQEGAILQMARYDAIKRLFYNQGLSGDENIFGQRDRLIYWLVTLYSEVFKR